MPKLWFAADLHLSHPNILKYEPQRVKALAAYLNAKRDFPNMSEEDLEHSITESLSDKGSFWFNRYLKAHDDMIIDKWNSVVKPKDTVIYLGDFAFCHKACKEDKNFNKLDAATKTAIQEYGNRLNGHKIMIMGNHDWRGTYHQGPMKGMHYVSTTIETFWKSVGFEAVYPNGIILKGYYELTHEPQPYIGSAMVRVNIFGHVHSDPRFATETDNSFCACIDKHNLFPVEYTKFNNSEGE